MRVVQLLKSWEKETLPTGGAEELCSQEDKREQWYIWEVVEMFLSHLDGRWYDPDYCQYPWLGLEKDVHREHSDSH